MSNESEHLSLNLRSNRKYSFFDEFKGRNQAEPIHLTWTNLKVYTKPVVSLLSHCKKGRNSWPNVNSKTILDHATGYAGPGDLIAFIGASGAGKTTLLNTLSRRKSAKLDVIGDVKVNGQIVSDERFKELSGYVGQDYSYFATMTVKEVMLFYANLKMDRSTSRKEREMLSSEILQRVGLDKVQNSIVGDISQPGISGGEKRRLFVATQLLFGAKILFLDEVTSGLDSFTAESIIKLIKNLADSGCTILCTIHQPTAGMYALFNKVCIMSESNIAFLGSPADALTFFKETGYMCPHYHSPADHFIHTLAVKPSDEDRCRERIASIVKSYKKSTFFEKNIDLIKCAPQTTAILTDCPKVTAVKFSFFNHLQENFIRGLKNIWRSRWYVKIRFVFGVVNSLMLGLLYSHTSHDIETVYLNKSGFFFTSVLCFAFRYTVSSSQIIPFVYPIIKREFQSGLYTGFPYFLSTIICEIVFLIPTLFLELLILFLLVDFKFSAQSFFTAYTCYLITCWTSQSIGYFIGVVQVTPKLAALTARTAVFPFLLLSGSGVTSADNNSTFNLRPFEVFSWIRYGVRALMVNEFTDLKLMCGDEECLYNGTSILQRVGISPDEIWWPDIISSFGIGLVFNILSCLLLGWRIAQPF